MVPITVDLPDALLYAVDVLVSDGRVKNRSAAVRAGLELLSRADREAVADRAFADGVRRHPNSESEIEDAHRLAVESIEDEPWTPWW